MLAAALAFLWIVSGGPATAADPARSGLVDLGQADPRWRGYHAPSGFHLEIVAEGPLLEAPVAMTFDDSGRLYVAESSPAERSIEVWDQVTLGDGTKLRLHRRRKPTQDVIKRLTDTDGDGRYDASAVVVAAVEQPTALIWYQDSLYVTALGRLERWKDGDGDGRFETKTILLDGFGAVDERGLSGLTLGADGSLYLTTGDNDNHPFRPQGAKVNLSGSGGLFRCRVDGSDFRLISSGFRHPRGGVAFDADFQPILIDDDGADGSKVAGVRLIQPIDQADYGWRRLQNPSTAPDHELGDIGGNRPGRLAGFARLSGSSPSSLVVYHGTDLPEACRGLVIATDPARHSVRGFKLGPPRPSPALEGETTLLVADDPRFRPEQVIVGADSALYILDPHQATPPRPETAPPGRPGGRIYRLSWRPGGATPNAPEGSPPNQWDRIKAMTNEQLLFQALPGQDHHAAERALRELVGRGVQCRPTLLTYAANTTLPSHVRLLGIQGSRQFWNEEVEANMVNLLADEHPEVRRLAAQVLASEPKQAISRLVPKLLERLDDPDGRVIREVALAIGRHGETNPIAVAPNLVRWLYAHPQAEVDTRDAVIRGLERLGAAGVNEVARAVRTRRGSEREQAVRLFSMLHSPHAAEELASLIKIPDLTGPERAVLIRQHADFPADLTVATTALVDWVVKHPEVEPLVKVAALETCRLAGNPASPLILALLDDDAEAVRLTAIDLARRVRPPGAMAKVAARLDDGSRSTTERLAAARSLGAGGPGGFSSLDSAYLGSESVDLRRAALRSLADADRPRSLPALTAALAGPDPLIRADALTILGETPAGAAVAGKAYLDRTLTRSDLPRVLHALQAHDSKEGGQLLAAVRQDATQGPSRLTPSSIQAQVAAQGNPWAGLEVFLRPTSRCVSCHQVGGKGGQAGPALDREARQLSAEKLIEAIQHPGHPLAPGSEVPRLASIGETKPTRPGPLAGVDRQSVGAVPPEQAVMPAGLDLTMTPREFADLVAFLLDPAARAAWREGGYQVVDQWSVAGPFAPGPDSLRVPLDRFEPERPLSGQDGRISRWSPLHAAEETGTIKLNGLFALQPGRAYATTQVQSKTAQTAWLFTSARGAARVYLNGAEVLKRPDQSTVAAGQTPTDVSRLTLKAGLNRLMVAFDSPATGDPLASFHLAAPEPTVIRASKN